MVATTLSCMAVWERAGVLALAPDPASASAASSLATPRPWTRLGHDESHLWGTCLGSGRAPYQSVVELGPPPAFDCSCPSRKSPCKHVLGLLLLWTAGGIPAARPEPFAAAWIARRSARGTAQVDTVDKPTVVDPEAVQRRAAARRDRVTAGLDDLDRWLRDQVRSGLAGLNRAGYAHFEQVAARMVDAQAPGVASMLRSMPSELAREDWPSRLLQSMAALRLLITAHRRIDHLPAKLAATVRSRIGYPVAKDEVLAGPPVVDRWTALGSVDTVEYRLETRRVWLRGSRSRRWALYLAFAPPGQRLEAAVSVGQAYEGALHFYPGSGQFRALVGQVQAVGGVDPAPAVDLNQLAREFAALVAADPWADRMPVVLAGVPVRPEGPGRPWRFRDTAGLGCDLVGLKDDPWPLLAHAAAGPVSLFGEWSSSVLRPISVLPDPQGRPFTNRLTQ